MSLVVSNTSPLTNVAVIDRVDLVRTQCLSITVPTAVWREMTALPHANGRAALLAARSEGWLKVVSLGSPGLASTLRLTGLDEGEAEAIALARESFAELLLIDEKKGRVAARHLGIPVTGALGIIAKARVLGAIPSARAEINRLRSEAGFYVSSEVEAHTLRIAGES